MRRDSERARRNIPTGPSSSAPTHLRTYAPTHLPTTHLRILPIPLHQLPVPFRRAGRACLHECLELGDLPRRPAGQPLHSAVGDGVIVLDAHADVLVRLDGWAKLRGKKANADRPSAPRNRGKPSRLLKNDDFLYTIL